MTVINENELIDLTALAYGQHTRGMIPSAGGCDEYVRLMLLRKQVSPEVVVDLQGRLTGTVCFYIIICNLETMHD